MTLDDAIKQLLNEAEKWESLVNGAYKLQDRDCTERAADHRQLAEWLKELKEAKRLLKAAVEDVSVTIAKVYNGGLICECCKWKSQIGECCCPDDGGCDVAYRWRYADEAIKLIGENTDETNT